ncbi:hypothetical protein [Brevundimonas sp.]|uniref:hypothetical protein n=1 Tax=Brevundimonas sp. TaxID=1871086 RepID=UPI0025B9EB58|nr:hypothetical protein [Brevundimonas sp.]
MFLSSEHWSGDEEKIVQKQINKSYRGSAKVLFRLTNAPDVSKTTVVDRRVVADLTMSAEAHCGADRGAFSS